MKPDTLAWLSGVATACFIGTWFVLGIGGFLFHGLKAGHRSLRSVWGYWLQNAQGFAASRTDDAREGIAAFAGD